MNILQVIMVTATIYHAVPEQTDSTPHDETGRKDGCGTARSRTSLPARLATSC